MAKLSLALVFALVLALPLHSVLGQEDPWQSVLSQASQAGISQETIDEAQKALGDGSAQKVAEDALGDEGDGASLGDWVSQARLDMGHSFTPNSTTFHIHIGVLHCYLPTS